MSGVPVPLSNLHHVGVAVSDVEATTGFLASIWNIGTSEPFDYAPTQEDLLVGEPYAIRIAFVKLGDVTLELIQPLDDRSIWSRFIAEKGEGVHHIAFGVSNYEELVAAFTADDHPMLAGAVYEGWRWSYFDSSPGGMVVEFLEEFRQSVPTPTHAG
jgi:methylmalonyl-CoA/ethylmalonyl-CoA epimerase